MIDLITSQDLQRLAQTTADHCVSLLMPTHRTGNETTQDPIRLKNLLTRAADELVALGTRSPEALQLLAPATALLQDSTFWAHQDNALALFLADGGLTTYRLPESVDETIVIADRFHLKPLVPSLATGKSFYVLALSQHQVRLLRGGPVHVAEIELRDIPESLAEALGREARERQLQSHSSGRTGRGGVTATFHGRGAAKDTTKVDLERFFQAVDAGVNQLITDPAPLVLAGVDYLIAAYRNISAYTQIVDTAIEGNPDRLSASELHARAWPLVEPLLDAGRAAAGARFLTGNGVTASLSEVLVAAGEGRVDTLFVPVDLHHWGAFDPTRHVLEHHETRQPGDRDLFDVAAIDALAHGSTVYVVPWDQIPGAGPLAATLRF